MFNSKYPTKKKVVVTSFQLAFERRERENMKPLIIYAFAEVKEEKWWISLKLNSNKKQFLLFLFHFITFHNLFSFLYIPVLSLFVVPYKPRVKKKQKIIYQITRILFPYKSDVIYIKMSSIRMRQEIY